MTRHCILVFMQMYADYWLTAFRLVRITLPVNRPTCHGATFIIGLLYGIKLQCMLYKNVLCA